MAKKKTNKNILDKLPTENFNIVEEDGTEYCKEGVFEEDVTEEVVEEVKDPKVVLLEDFMDFYNTNVKGHSTVPATIGREIVNYFNRYTNRNSKYTGCSSCIVSKITYLRREAAKRGLIF